MRQLILAIFSFFLHTVSIGQDFSNKGKEFWVGYGNHVSMFNSNGTVNPGGGAQEMVLYFTSDKNAVVKVDIPALGWSKTYNVVANQVTTSDVIPKTGAQDARLTTEGKSNNGIHITSDIGIIAYAHIYNSSISGATLLFPVNTLAREYYSINFTQVSNDVNSFCFAYVIATEDDTNIEIELSANSIFNNKGDIIKVNLNKGQVYNVFGRKVSSVGNTHKGEDLTGTKIKSVATATSPCKKISVFSGSSKLSITCDANSGSADNYMQQAFPANAWGKKYLTTSTRDMPNNYFRVAVSNSSAIVKRNGVPLTGLVNNFYYEFLSNTADLIESDKSIMVAQYISTANKCGNSAIGGNGDPEMIYLSPIEQTIDKVTINSTPNSRITLHYVNLVIHKNGLSSLKVDGTLLAASLSATHPQDANYIYFQLPVLAGSHTIQSDSGFNAIAYGYGSAETYGYNAGANVKDLYQTLTTNNKFAKVKLPATCKGTPFNISITLPYEPISLEWKIPTYAAIPKDNAPQKDSSKLVNGKTVYYYSLKKNYVYDTIKTYSIQVIANNPTADGCTGEQQIDFDLQVFEPPKAGFDLKTSNCVKDSLLFSDTTVVVDRPIVGYYWDFGDGSVDSLKSVKHKYASQGKYTIKYYAYTDVGCVSEIVSKDIFIDNTPLVDFSISGTTCQNKDVTYMDASSPATGTSLSKWYWNFGNADPKVTNTSNAAVISKYSAFQQYTASLVVETSNGCKSVEKKLTFTNNPNPIVDFKASKICLPDGIGTFTDLSSIADGSESTFLRKWNFGDQFATTSNPDNVVNQLSPRHFYQTTGPYNVKLVVESNNGCIDSIVKPLTEIYSQPKTNFNVSSEVCLRENTIFKDLTNGQARTVTSWNWTFSNGTTSNLKDPSILIGGSGNYTATLFSFTTDGCVSDTVTKSFTVHPLPTPDFTIGAPVCETQSIVFTQTAVANVGNITRWNWVLGNGTSPIDIINAVTAVDKTFAVWGDQSIKLMVENSKGCKSDTLTRVYRIHPKPVVNYSLPEVCLSDAFAQFVSTVSIADNSTGFSYLWNFGDPNANSTNLNTGIGASISHKYSAAAIYNVNLQVTSAAGCISSLPQSFTVNGATPKAGFNVINENGLCSNKDVSIKNLSVVDFGSVTKLEIYWDYTNNPTVFFTDETPTLNKVYNFLYNNFQSQPTKTFTIRIRAYSGGSCADDELRTITLNGSPLVSFQALPGICLEAVARQITQATFTDVTGLTTGKELYEGIGVSNTGLFTPLISGAGTFPLKYTFTANNGCSIFTSQNMLVWPRPTADFSISALQCEKNPLTFTNKSIANAGTIVKWNWDFGDGNPVQSFANGNAVTNTYAVYKSYTASLDVVTNNGCTSVPKILPIVINPLPLVNFELPKVCLPVGKALFINKTTIPDATTMTYLWNFGDPFDPSAAVTVDGNHNYKNLQSYNVKLIATSNNNCKDSLLRNLVDVFPQPKSGFKSADSACIGTAINFTDTSNGIVRPVSSWSWDFGDGSTDNIKDPIFLYRTTGTFKLSLFVTSSEGCLSDTTYKSITIHPYPKVSAGPDLYVLDDGEKKIAATASGSALRFSWDPPAYLNASNILQPTVIRPLQDIIYTLSVTGRGGCTSTDDVAIIVLKLPKPPNTFTPNGDGINDRWDIKYLDQYPGCVVEIYTTQGLLVHRTTGYTNSWDGTFKGNIMPTGTYYYVIDPRNGRKKIAGYVTILK